MKQQQLHKYAKNSGRLIDKNEVNKNHKIKAYSKARDRPDSWSERKKLDN